MSGQKDGLLKTSQALLHLALFSVNFLSFPFLCLLSDSVSAEESMTGAFKRLDRLFLLGHKMKEKQSHVSLIDCWAEWKAVPIFQDQRALHV